MFLRSRFATAITVILTALLLAYPSAIFGQRGAGGGHTGGGVAGGGGLSGGNGGPAGIDVKDDLKGFHAALAVQATSQQIVAYSSMMQSTDAASVELGAFLEQLGKQYNPAGLLSRGTILAQAIEKARSENQKFLGGFSDKQKSGLREITKKLLKDDSELAQQAKAMASVAGDANLHGQAIANSAQSLAHALSTFRTGQIDLGEELSIGSASGEQSSKYDIPPKISSLSFENQPITITTSGVISSGVRSNPNVLGLELTTDLSDLQQNLTEVLRRQLNRSNSCGEQIALRTAVLTPSAPAGLAEVQLHYERWACLRRGNANEMVEGNGTIAVTLTPAIGEDGLLRLVPAITRVDGQGIIGELLRSGSLGEEVRDKVVESVLSTMQRGLDYKAMIPAAAQGTVTLRHVQFQQTGAGKLTAVLAGDIQVSNDQAASLASKSKASEAKGQPPPAEIAPR